MQDREPVGQKYSLYFTKDELMDLALRSQAPGLPHALPPDFANGVILYPDFDEFNECEEGEALYYASFVRDNKLVRDEDGKSIRVYMGNKASLNEGIISEKDKHYPLVIEKALKGLTLRRRNEMPVPKIEGVSYQGMQDRLFFGKKTFSTPEAREKAYRELYDELDRQDRWRIPRAGLDGFSLC